MRTLPVPDAALDDRLGLIGTSGSGKTYAASALVERLLEIGARVVILDPLGVWWGLRLEADGKKPSPFHLPIFGGEHGDVPISENAGKLVGETVAAMSESCLVDISGFGTRAGERRFALGFFQALEKKSRKAPLHLVLDEADLWAPQSVSDKEGEANKLLGVVESIVRRGRIRGFRPWLISQRPAVLNKNVLSQVDGLVAFKLTSSQDRKALGEWIQGQADVDEGKKILADLPTLARGDAQVWIPGRGILAREHFPTKRTFDSSRTPERGEKIAAHELRPLDVEALRSALASVEAEIKASDPRALQAKVVELQRELRAEQAKKPAAAPAPAKPSKAEERARAEEMETVLRDSMRRAVDASLDEVLAAIAKVRAAAAHAATQRSGKWRTSPAPYLKLVPPSSTKPAEVKLPAEARAKSEPIPEHVNGYSGPERKLLEALAFWLRLGFDCPSREQLAAAAGYSTNSKGFKNPLGALKTRGVIRYPEEGAVSAADPDALFAFETEDGGSVRQRLERVLDGPQRKLLDVLLEAGEPLLREQLASEAGYSSNSKGFKNPLGALRSLELVDYPADGLVEVRSWVRK